MAGRLKAIAKNADSNGETLPNPQNPLTQNRPNLQALRNSHSPPERSRAAPEISKLAPMLKPIFLLCGALCISSGARACLWDKDTLETEAKGVPTAIKAISGRFERNPPLYYEMRFQRVSAQIRKTPRDFNLYDDAAVAQSRLGKPAEALRWIEKKRAVLGALNTQNTLDWYRYYANAGTFSMQKWLMDGANKANLGDLKTARDQIKRAIEINPDAHFGREKYQLGYIEWLLNPKVVPNTTVPLFWNPKAKNASAEKAVEGISGLITEGLGWENVDVFRALGAAIMLDETRNSAAYLAFARVGELVKSGARSVEPKHRFFSPHVEWEATQIKVPNVKDYSWIQHESLNETFKKMRAEANAYHARRTDWMLQKLNSGEHPDTNPAFWNGYNETPAPQFSGNDLNYRARFSPALLWLLVPLGASYLVLKRRKSAQ